MSSEKNWLEWCVFALGLLLVCGTLGYLAYDAISQDGSPPALEVRLGAPVARQGYYEVPVTVHNRGGSTSEQVLVRVELKVNGNVEETAEFQVPHLPRHSDRQGVVTFKRDPRQGQLSGRAVGYERP